MKDREASAARKARINHLQAEIIRIERGQAHPDSEVSERLNVTADALIANIEAKAANFASGLNLLHFGGKGIHVDFASEGAIAYFFKDQLAAAIPDLATKIVTRNGKGLAPFTPPLSDSVAQERLAALRKELADLQEAKEG